MNFKPFVLTAAIALLVGCSTMTEIRSDARDSQQATHDVAQGYLDSRPARILGPSTGPVVTDLPYVDARPMARAPRYPASFSRQVTVNEPMGVPISVMAQRVFAMTGVRVTYQSEIGGGAAVIAPSSGGAATMGDATLANLPPLANLPTLPAAATIAPSAGVALTYTGDVVGLFNAIASATNSQWEYDEGGQTVQFYRFKTTTFRIPAVQGESASSASMGKLAQSGGGGQNTQISMASAEGEHTTKNSVWDEIEGSLKHLVSSEGVYSISPAMGAVTVRDRPDRVETVRSYLQEMTDALSRQVEVDVTIYRVLVSDADTRGVNWAGLFRDALGRYSIGFDTMLARPEVLSGGLSSAIIDVPLTDGNGIDQRWGGSQVILDALSTLGRASVVTNTSVLTANNQPAPVKIVKRTSYLAEVAQNLANSGNGDLRSTGPTLTPGMVETGLNLYVLPHVMDDGKRMLLKMMVSMSTLESLDSYGNELAQIQLPQVSAREFEPLTWINSGETLVLAGFEQVDSGIDTRTPLDKRLWLFGGSSSAKKSREMVVVTIRPVVTAVRSRI